MHCDCVKTSNQLCLSGRMWSAIDRTWGSAAVDRTQTHHVNTTLWQKLYNVSQKNVRTLLSNKSVENEASRNVTWSACIQAEGGQLNSFSDTACPTSKLPYNTTDSLRSHAVTNKKLYMFDQTSSAVHRVVLQHFSGAVDKFRPKITKNRFIVDWVVQGMKCGRFLRHPVRNVT